MKTIKKNNTLNINRHLLYLPTVLLFLAISISCSKNDALEPATVSGMSPQSGAKNIAVTISGSNFGNNVAKVTVYFNDVEAIVHSVSDREIKTEVPTLAMTGLVKVIVDGTEITGPEFTYQFSEAYVTTLAGNKNGNGHADGQGAEAKFGVSDGIALDKHGNLIIAQPFKNSIRKITPEGLVATLTQSEDGGLVEGSLNEAKFSWPLDIVMDGNYNAYLTDSNNNRIRKISTDHTVSTFAGSTQGYEDGEGNIAKFFLPKFLTVDKLGNVYVSEYNNSSNQSRIRKITPEGLVSTFAGGEIGDVDGDGVMAKFGAIGGLAIDNFGNIIVSDRENHKIRKISPTGKVTTIAGSTEGYEDGNRAVAKFKNPSGLAVDKLDNIYVADYSNHRIRKISPNGMVSTLAGKGSYGFDDGEGLDASIAYPRAIIVDDNFNLYFTQNFIVRKIAQE